MNKFLRPRHPQRLFSDDRLKANDSYTFLMKELEKVDEKILEPLAGTDWPRDMPVITGGGLLESIVSIDVTYGDVITPAATLRDFVGILDDSFRIRLLAYTTETLMAEKVQSILKRGVATTRPRDFYDLHMLCRKGGYDAALFAKALRNTIENRHSEAFLSRWRETVRDIASSDFQKQQWTRYQKRMPYARDIPFDDLVGSLSGLLEKIVGA